MSDGGIAHTALATGQAVEGSDGGGHSECLVKDRVSAHRRETTSRSQAAREHTDPGIRPRELPVFRGTKLPKPITAPGSRRTTATDAWCLKRRRECQKLP